MKTYNQPGIDPFLTGARIRRLRLNQRYFAKRHRVSDAAVTGALRGRKGLEQLLIKIHHSLDVIENQRGRTVKTVQSAKNLTNKYRRK
jgi:hypothetical protein